MRTASRLLAAAIIATVIGLGLWAFWIEPASLRLVEYSVPLRNAPSPLPGLRIAVIADLHAGAPFIDAEKLRRVTALTDQSRPDLILIAGDIFAQRVFGGVPLPGETTAEALRGLHAPLGVYAVLGNHDYDGHEAQYRELLRAAGILPLDNDVHQVSRGPEHFWLAGFGDLQYGRPDVPGTLAKITDGAPVIALTHDPLLFGQIPASVNLVVAGHTHGGQARLPLLWPLVLRLMSLPNHDLRYLKGHYREQTDLFVSSGIGTSGLPVRFRVPPEISLLTLTADPLP